jgi:4-amino-4-deoxy-L-arabinose transferase-like glycosyltransferase
MSSSVRRAVAVAAVALAAMIYAPGLDVSPIYLTHDEVIYARNAYSIANSGRDLNGQLFPISIPVVGTFYATPANIYTTAAFLKVLPLNEVTIRLPSVIIGLLCVWLAYLIASRIFESRPVGVAAASMLLLTPAHFIHSRLGTDHLYVVVCVLSWMALLTSAASPITTGRVFAASAFLGVSLYTYLGALITAPLCVLVTLAWLAYSGRRDWRPYAAAVAGFVVPAIPFVIWHLTHPGQYAEQIRMYALYDSNTLSATEGARQLASAPSIADRAAVYWDYFNPSFLFFAGDTGLLNGTRYTGVFLLPMAILIPVGLAVILMKGGSARVLLAMTFAIAPAAAVTVGERYRINRALVLLPIAAMIGAAAIDWMWQSRSRVSRWAAVALLAVMPLQFAGFYRDYFTDYRVRSAPWFEYNLRGAMEEIMRRPDASNGVWIAQGLNWADYYWPFYLDRHGRRDLAPATHYFDVASADLAAIPRGTYILCSAHDEPRFTDAGFTRIAAVREPDQSHSLSVLQR